MSAQRTRAPANDATSLRELARTPELRACWWSTPGRGFACRRSWRGVLAIFVALTVVFVPPAGARLAALLIAVAYCVWAVAVYVAVRVDDERVLRLNWIALIGDVVALGLVTLTAASADNVSWTGDLLLVGFFLVPVLAAVQLRVWVAVTAAVPNLAVFLACSAIARQAEDQPWSYVLLRVLALAGLSVGCVLLVEGAGLSRARHRQHRDAPRALLRRAARDRDSRTCRAVRRPARRSAAIHPGRPARSSMTCRPTPTRRCVPGFPPRSRRRAGCCVPRSLVSRRRFSTRPARRGHPPTG